MVGSNPPRVTPQITGYLESGNSLIQTKNHLSQFVRRYRHDRKTKLETGGVLNWGEIFAGAEDSRIQSWPIQHLNSYDD